MLWAEAGGLQQGDQPHFSAPLISNRKNTSVLSAASLKCSVSVLENDAHSLKRCLYSFSVSEADILHITRAAKWL